MMDFPFRLDHIFYGNIFDEKKAKVIDIKGLSNHKTVLNVLEIR